MLSTFGPLSLDLYLPALPEPATELAASTSVAQPTLTACLVGLAAGQVVAEPLSDRGRAGRRPWWGGAGEDTAVPLGLVAATASLAACAVFGGW